MGDLPLVGVLRMPMGNLRSAVNAVIEQGFVAAAVDELSDFDALTHLIVPGVGNFHAVMGHLAAAGLDDRIRAFAASGRPLLGICVGMQLLAESSVEGSSTAGLGLVQGKVTRLPDEGERLLPHVGWSAVEFRFTHPIVAGVKPARDFYFVHSYALQSNALDEVLGVSDYGASFVSIVATRNVVGFQFHPEKSQANGLKLIRNFCEWDGRT